MLEFIMPVRVAVAVDILAWGACHTATGNAAHRLTDRHLDHDGWLLRPRGFEDSGRWYRRRLRINSWKGRVPEAGNLFHGGISKSQLPAPTGDGVTLFIRETRRAELAHWWALTCGPRFALWNRPLATVLLISYGIMVNLPFIAIQRYNRFRCQAFTDRRPGGAGSGVVRRSSGLSGGIEPGAGGGDANC
jgi:glycosyl-4,4'-diaponeurosporenoate acyltransferase